MSYGEPAQVDTPVLRIPMTVRPPEIDGVMSPGEWEDASSLSGFWYDFANADFRYLAPVQTQLQAYVAYDKTHLYFAFRSPIYPRNSWLKARGRFPDVLSHPLYGILWDDHIELELRPYPDLAEGFQLGLLRFDVNPINSTCDWYWSQQGGQDMKWQSRAKIRSLADGERWVIEIAMPHAEMAYGSYTGQGRDGKPLVSVPPADGTIYRTWMVRGIGGNGAFFNAFDNHIWNTTKTQLVFDSKAPSFQIQELGNIMEDTLDVTLAVKNHDSRSQTVQLGFFVENAAGRIYSSYDAPELKDGLLELVPGERREIRLRQPFPGVTAEDNVLWFDVRSAGQPARQLFRTRLIRFHSMDGGSVSERKLVFDPGSPDPQEVEREVSFRERRLDVIEKIRPPRMDFDFRWNFSPYTKRVSAVVDRGIHGASEEARRAVEARLSVLEDSLDEDVVKESRIPFQGDFACFMLDLPELVEGEKYKLSLLLFDASQRIVGERNPEPFAYRVEPWQNNRIGLDDGLWEPFTAIEKRRDGFETLKHRFTLSSSGLPSQVWIKPDIRELPLEKRQEESKLSEAELSALGRGPQLRAPMRLEVLLGGQRVSARVKEAARLVRAWKSELEYASRLQLGPLSASLTVQYDADGALHGRLVYGTEKAADVEGLELVADAEGPVDLALSETGQGGMAGADAWEIALPPGPGIVWDSTRTQMELMYSRFVPYFWFGSGDRGWTWFCDSDQGWHLDREGSSLQLERDREGRVTWRVRFINHPCRISGSHRIDFSILTHPAKPKPPDFRHVAWHHFAGDGWADGYNREPIDLPEEYLKSRWHVAASAPRGMPWEQAATWRKDDPPYHRYGRWRNVGVCPELDREWEDKATYFFERHIRVGRRVGWWMDEYFPVAFGRSDNLAAGNAYLRQADRIGAGELPWQSGFLTTPMRNHYKRLARVFAANNVPQRQHTWSNNAATFLESFVYSSLLVEECGAAHRSHEIDVLTQFPNSLCRYLSKSFTGLVTTVCADSTPATAGDDKRLDRQLLGRALLHDFGVSPAGPHGIIHHKEQGVRLLARLTEFGFFEDSNIEKIPFWRSSGLVRLGPKPPEGSRVYVTVYRRPLEGGRGTKALLVVLNESQRPVELPLEILDSRRLFGGPNGLTASAALRRVEIPPAWRQQWDHLQGQNDDVRALQNLETGEIVARVPGKNEVYGPVYVPYHDFRVLTGHGEAAP
ncbi:MAG: hypothetical protein HYU36_05615 [Planctomycetes bacterium]|nr:hypothetical protein [Planctomycetota bacterium]